MSLFHRSVLLLIFTSVFLSLFLLIEGFFFSPTIEQQSEDIHMEKSRILDDATLYEQKVAQDILANTIKKETQKKEKIQAFLQKKAQEKKTPPPKQDKNPPTKSYEFFYYPDDLSLEIQSQSEILQYFLSLDFIASKLSFLRVEFFSKTIDVRGKMKDASIKLFSLLDMKSPELLSVFIHEFGHYVDIYTLQGDFISSDKSDSFYSISWESTKILKASQDQADFVSGYAMTNKYEDFAESFVYYILHNVDFQTKASKSALLQAKFEFIQKNIFDQEAFFDTDFSRGNTVKSYYRDITKIEIDETIFLQYIKKFI